MTNRSPCCNGGAKGKICCQSSKKCCSLSLQNVRLVLLLSAVAVGILLGAILRNVPPFDQPKLNPRPLVYLMFPGELKIRASMLLSLPMILCSLISGIASLDARTSGKVGMRAMAYYVTTTCVAAVEGFALMYAIRPGANVQLEEVEDTKAANFNNVDSLLDMFRNIFPDNLIEACFSITKTDITFKEVEVENGTNTTVVVEAFKQTNERGMNILGLTMFVIVFSILLSRTGERRLVILEAVDVLFEVFMNFFQLLLWIFPIGITCVLATIVIKMPDPLAQLEQMVYFILTVWLGLFIHFFITLPLIFFVFLRKNPFKQMKACAQAFLTAFATGNRTRFRTTVNVWGDCVGAPIIAHLSRKDLKDPQDENQNAAKDDLNRPNTVGDDTCPLAKMDQDGDITWTTV